MGIADEINEALSDNRDAPEIDDEEMEELNQALGAVTLLN